MNSSSYSECGFVIFVAISLINTFSPAVSENMVMNYLQVSLL